MPRTHYTLHTLGTQFRINCLDFKQLCLQERGMQISACYMSLSSIVNSNGCPIAQKISNKFKLEYNGSKGLFINVVGNNAIQFKLSRILTLAPGPGHSPDRGGLLRSRARSSS